jgi:hypothetical protein
MERGGAERVGRPAPPPGFDPDPPPVYNTRMSRRRGQKASPDPSGPAAVNGAYPANGGADPQAWNASAYVANQPLAAADPLGLTVPCGGMFGGPCGGALAGPTLGIPGASFTITDARCSRPF